MIMNLRKKLVMSFLYPEVSENLFYLSLFHLSIENIVEI